MSVIMASGILAAATVATQGAVSDVHHDEKRPQADAVVEVFVDSEIGPVRVMNAVNGAPHGEGTENFIAWQGAAIPYARTHDLDLAPRFGAPHAFNVTSIFPDFDADENNTASYDFACTDEIISRMIQAGTKPFYRLGGMYEGWIKKRYTTIPPKDAAKWARICEHIIAHYNEGWANGFKYGIVYWEIWNEPNLNLFWTGTREQFTDLFTTAAAHLKTRFPNIKIGGPAMAGTSPQWTEALLKACAEKKTPLDFFSWHGYETQPNRYASHADWVRKTLDQYGYTQAESILNEWNYVKDFGRNYDYSLQVMRGDQAHKGAAFIAASMSVMQRAPVDMGMFYCAWGAAMDSLFDKITDLPSKGYYPFFAWNRLRELGTEVKTTASAQDLYVTAAKSSDGRVSVLLTRYNEDNNVTADSKVEVRISGTVAHAPRLLVTDEARTFTDTYCPLNSDGSVTLRLHPNAMAFLEY